MNLGTHIRTPGTMYDHHMLVIRVIHPHKKTVLVIHYATLGGEMSGKLGLDNQIIEEEKTITDKIEVAVYKDGVVIYTPEEAIARARSRKGEAKYKLLSNNCESFVNWALTGEDVTDQGDAAPKKIALGAAIGVGVGAAAVYGISRMSRKDSDRKKDDV